MSPNQAMKQHQPLESRNPKIGIPSGAPPARSDVVHPIPMTIVSPVPLTIIKSASAAPLPLPTGVNGSTADFHTTRTNTTSQPTHLTSGLYKIESGPARPAAYEFEESKFVLRGSVDVLDEATGIKHHLVPGDFAFFHVGSKVQFSTESEGLAFYVVTRPVRTPHPSLMAEAGKARL